MYPPFYPSSPATSTALATSATGAGAALLEAFELLKPRLEQIQFKTTKTIQKTKRTFFMELTIALVPLVVAGYMLTRLMKNMDPDAGKKRENEELRKQLYEKLRLANKPMIPITDTYETTILNDITLPHTIDVTFADIGGYEQIKNDLYETVILPLQSPELFTNASSATTSSSTLLSPPRGVLFYGPPGTGKTMMAKAIAHSCSATFINVRLSTLQNKWYGESQKLVKAVFSLAVKLAPTIIFIDEVDLFMRRRSSNDHEATGTMKAEFMSLWDGLTTAENSQVTVLGCTNRPFDIDEAILRRMPRSFLFDLPDQRQREEILHVLLRASTVDESVSIEDLAQRTDRYSGSDLKELCRYAAMIPIRELLKQQKQLHDINTLGTPSSQSSSLSSSAKGTVKQRPRPINISDFTTALKNVEPTGTSALEYSRHFQKHHLNSTKRHDGSTHHTHDNPASASEGIPFQSPYSDNTDDTSIVDDFVKFIVSKSANTTPQPQNRSQGRSGNDRNRHNHSGSSSSQKSNTLNVD